VHERQASYQNTCHSGCRISEALALEIKDIDFAQGTVTIQTVV